MAMGKGCVSNFRRKRLWSWVSLVILCLITLGILSLRGQNLLVKEKYEAAAINAPNPLLSRAVFSPLARSIHIRNVPFAAVKHVVYEGDTAAAEGFSSGSLSDEQWWISDSQAMPTESDSLQPSSEKAQPEGFACPDPRPKLLHRELDTQAIILNFIALGVEDLVNDLRENDLRLQSKKDESNMNPFDKALKEASKEAEEASGGNAAEDKNGNSEADPATDEGKNKDDAAGTGGSPIYRKLLFVGGFNGQALATAIGSANAEVLRQSVNNTVVIDLNGVGKLTLDMDVVLRDRDNQESVAYGDVNHDGFSDMVVTNKTKNKTSIFRNDGENNYRFSGEIFGGLGPSTALISDFNGDGSADIAVALQIDKTIIVDGKGLRKFIFFPTSPVEVEFSSMLPYDFDGDGLLDLLLSDYQNLTAFVYLNKGQGLFAESGSFDLLSLSYLQSRVDLDGDGIEDLAYIQRLGDRFSVVVINGRDHTTSNLGNMTLDASRYFVLGDFNVDGVIDVAIARRK
jgi:hypothetical protein